MRQTTNDLMEFGLVASNRFGAWAVTIDETLDGDQAWFLEIDGPSVYLRFQIADLATIPACVKILESTEFVRWIELGWFGTVPVSVCRDDEGERCFLMVGPQLESCARYSFDGEDLVALRTALQNLSDELPLESPTVAAKSA